MKIAIIGGGLASPASPSQGGPKTTTRGKHIAIIGGGFTGLTAAYELAKAGHRITIFEKEAYLGGLAYGFRKNGWRWHIEAAYHHLFTNDRHILGLIRNLGIPEKLIITRPVTSTMWNGKFYPLDSPLNLMRFPGLSPADKFRTAGVLGFLKFFPFWKILEHVSAEKLLITIGGKSAWQTIWEPLLYGKFGAFAPTVAASWFWARIVKRTPSLCYISGGFHTLVTALEKAIKKNHGVIYTSTTVKNIKKLPSGKIRVSWNSGEKLFDRVLLTLPTPLAAKIIPDMPESYIKPLSAIPHVHAQVLILETDRPILKDTYWLNVTDRSFPFLAAVAHTNFMDAKYYGGKHLTYFGNYLPQNHPYLSMTKQALLKTFLPAIRKLSPGTRLRITDSFMFVGPYAQPVHQQKYSTRIPKLATPITGIFMANMDYVVPWDRGTNYAVELGLRAARAISSRTRFGKTGRS